MTFYVDYAAGGPSALAVKQAGAAGVCRYLSMNPAKNLTADERDALLAAGLDIVLVWETTATRSSEGAAAGATDGMLAGQQAKALGYPQGATVYAATDQDTLWSKVEAYHRAFGQAISDYGYVGDVYGGYLVVSAAKAAGYSTAPWQTASWSYGSRCPGAALLQNNFQFPLSGGADGDLVLGPVNGWRANMVATSTKGGPVSSFTVSDWVGLGKVLKSMQDTIILHVREPLAAKIDALQAEIDALKAGK